MVLYRGSQKIEDLYVGSTKISELYYGSTLVYKSCKYNPNQVIYESSTAGTATVDLLENGVYQVICIGGGGGGTGFRYKSPGSGIEKYHYHNIGGASGSGFNIQFRLTKGNYSINVGKGGKSSDSKGGNSTFGSCTSYGGGTGSPSAPDAPTVNYTIVSTSFNKAGNAGSYYSSPLNTKANGGASVYDNTSSGYGAGGVGQYEYSTAGKNGYVKIVYIGR